MLESWIIEWRIFSKHSVNRCKPLWLWGLPLIRLPPLHQSSLKRIVKRRLPRRSHKAKTGHHHVSIQFTAPQLRLGTPSYLIFLAKSIIDHEMDKSIFYYVYIIQSVTVPDRFYTGFTENIEIRLKDHNTGKDLPTSALEIYAFNRNPHQFDTSKKNWNVNTIMNI